ncbi:MAG: DUF1501 domain-containing protein, partial [Gemmataceae bacterium]|nr:DUF1501 domain-containing protein [Gemmataceae bacterium]
MRDLYESDKVQKAMLQSRRNFILKSGAGFAAIPLASILGRDGFFKSQAVALESSTGLQNPAPHFSKKAKHCVFLFMNGAPSQVDTFDHKPALDKHHGKPYAGKTKVGSNGRAIGYLMRSPFEFNRYGKSGLEISNLFPNTALHADDLCVLKALYTDTAAHSSGCLQMNTGSPLTGKPSLGSWLSYGLGSLNESLPNYVVMTDPRGGPIGGAPNWGNGYMPAKYQGTLFRSGGAPLLDLSNPTGVNQRAQRYALDFLNELNQQHLRSRSNESDLHARISNYELAYRMQTSATEVVNIDNESLDIKNMYGINNPITADFGKKCLITRRLIEKGVRFIQLYSGGGHIESTWDGHNDCITNHKTHAAETDQPIAALMTDLKQRGLWDETLLVWGGEFGRTPTSEGVNKPGRDHNWLGFTMWLAGGGVKGGQAIGETDELGFEGVSDRYHVSDLHATILHLMGFDYRHLTYFYSG